MAVGAIVCLVNRTSRFLTVTKNGRETVLKPGDNHVNADLVRFARAQNPLPGSKSPIDLKFTSLVGVKGLHDCSEISDEILDMMPNEVLDRSQLSADRQVGVVSRQTAFPRGRVGFEAATPGMVDPGSAFGGN